MPARHFQDAVNLIGRPDAFDIAVVDLSWTGDATLGTRPRDNIGLKLVEQLYECNRTGQPHRPVIVLSQNYTKDPELVPLVVRKDALPVPKNYTPTGHQAIGGAIAYVSQHATRADIRQPPPDRDKIFLVHGHDIGLLNEVARFLERLKQTPVILRKQPNAGKQSSRSLVILQVWVTRSCYLLQMTEEQRFRHLSRSNNHVRDRT